MTTSLDDLRHALAEHAEPGPVTVQERLAGVRRHVQRRRRARAAGVAGAALAVATVALGAGTLPAQHAAPQPARRPSETTTVRGFPALWQGQHVVTQVSGTAQTSWIDQPLVWPAQVGSVLVRCDRRAQVAVRLQGPTAGGWSTEVTCIPGQVNQVAVDVDPALRLTPGTPAHLGALATDTGDPVHLALALTAGDGVIRMTTTSARFPHSTWIASRSAVGGQLGSALDPTGAVPEGTTVDASAPLAVPAGHRTLHVLAHCAGVQQVQVLLDGAPAGASIACPPARITDESVDVPLSGQRQQLSFDFADVDEGALVVLGVFAD